MATLKDAILESAFDDGFIGKRLTANEKNYFMPSVVTANAIWLAVMDAGEQGLDTEQICRRVGIKNVMTCQQYARWLIKKGVLHSCKDKRKRGHYIIYYVERKRRL